METGYTCVICDQDHEKKNVQRIRTGIVTLISNCEVLNKHSLATKLTESQETINDVHIYVHNACRNTIQNSASNITSQSNQANSPDIPSKRRQSSVRKDEQTFKWKSNCSICAKPCNDEKHSEKCCLCEIVKKEEGKSIPGSTKNKILEIIKERTDEQSRAIKGRLLSCSDLPPVEARYHLKCRSKLNASSLNNSHPNKRDRPSNEVQMKSFYKLCNVLECECELYSVAELYEKMRLLSDNPDDPNQISSSHQYLKNKLKAEYGDNIFFSNNSNKSDVVFFKSNAESIVNDPWYTERIKDAEEESTRIIKTAAKLIQMQLRSVSYDMTCYPSNEIIGDLEYNKDWMPSLLRTFLEIVVSNKLKQATIGQTLIHAARPKSSLPPIMFGTSAELDHIFGSKWLLIELSRIGLCLGPEEVNRYKQSIVENESIDDLMKSASRGSFSQWSADNVDHNVKTIDGKGTLHGMGMIVSTTGGNIGQISKELP